MSEMVDALSKQIAVALVDGIEEAMKQSCAMELDGLARTLEKLAAQGGDNAPGLGMAAIYARDRLAAVRLGK